MAGESSEDNRHRFLRWLVGLPRAEGDSRPGSEPSGAEHGPAPSGDADAASSPAHGDEELAGRLAAAERALQRASERAERAEERARRAESKAARLEDAIARVLGLWFGDARHRAAEELENLLPPPPSATEGMES